MKTKGISLLIASVLLLVLAFSVGSHAAPSSKPSTPAASASAAQPSSAAREPHPEIREALASLHRAKEHLEHAAHDFGGHRVEAIRAIDASMHQLEECLRYDKD